MKPPHLVLDTNTTHLWQALKFQPYLYFSCNINLSLFQGKLCSLPASDSSPLSSSKPEQFGNSCWVYWTPSGICEKKKKKSLFLRNRKFRQKEGDSCENQHLNCPCLVRGTVFWCAPLCNQDTSFLQQVSKHGFDPGPTVRRAWGHRGFLKRTFGWEGCGNWVIEHSMLGTEGRDWETVGGGVIVSSHNRYFLPILEAFLAFLRLSSCACLCPNHEAGVVAHPGITVVGTAKVRG